MPKIVDPDARRREVGEAVLRVVGRLGAVEGASFTAIAAEAGLAVGSVRHYFPNHDAILQFAMQELADRVGERLGRRLASLEESPDLGAVEGILAELLPVDEQRRLEADVWLAFVAGTPSRPALGEIAQRAARGIRTVVEQVLAGAQRRELIEPAELAVETERLAALLDGLTLAIIRPPHLPVDTARTVLRRHLNSLAG